MATTTDRLAAISNRHAQQRDSIVEKLLKLLLGLWGDFTIARDPDQVTALAARSATLVFSATSRMRLQTRSYNASVMRELGQKLTLPSSINPYPRANVSPLAVYSRPAAQFIYELSQGATVDEATETAGGRLGDLVEQDVLLADRDESRRIYDENPVIVGYRRVIHPELAKDGMSCGLCVVASNQWYGSGDLMPIHEHCHCLPMPIVKGDDPGHELNRDDLDKLYAAAGGTFGELLKEVRVSVDEHGELGPVLVRKGDHFRTPEEAGRPAYKKPTVENLRKQNAADLADATTQLDAAVDELAQLQKKIPSGLDYGRLTDDMSALVDRRTTLTQLTKNLRDYIAMLQAAGRSL
jgi:hypothetical protein